jgi:hypothetical protein
MPSSTFLKEDLSSIASMSFFTVEVLTLGGLIRFFVLLVIDIKTRCVRVARPCSWDRSARYTTCGGVINEFCPGGLPLRPTAVGRGPPRATS